jgi:hypothetical protein
MACSTGVSMNEEEVKLEKWIFTGFVRPDLCPYEEYVKHGFTTAIIGLNNQDDDKKGISANKEDLEDVFELRWGSKSEDSLNKGIEKAQALGLDVLLMPWLRLTDPWMNTLTETLSPVLDKHDRVGICADTEKAFRVVIEKGLTHQEAADKYFAPTLGQYLRQEPHTLFYVSDYAYPPKAVEPILPFCDGVIPQAYAPKWSNQVPYTIQLQSYGRWAKILRPDQDIIMGLGSYSQGRPGQSVEKVMKKSYDGAVDAGCTKVAYWSWPSSSKAAKRFLASL